MIRSPNRSTTDLRIVLFCAQVFRGRVLRVQGFLPLVAAGLLATTSGCINLIAQQVANRVKVSERRLVKKKLKVRAGPEQLRIYQKARDLPRGLFYFRGRSSRRLFAVVNYPSPAAPHRVLAVYTWRGGRGASRYQIPEEITERASRLGATALFRPSRRSRRVYALLVSRARPTRPRPAARTLLRSEAADQEGFRPLGRPETRSLQDLERIKIPTRPAYCYKLAVALARDAELGAQGQRGILTRVRSADPLIRHRRGMPTERVRVGGLPVRAPVHGRYVNLRSFTVNVGCAMTSSSASVQITAARRQTNLGRGTVLAQLLVQRISREELKERKAEADRRYARARARAERYRRERARRREERRRRLRAERRRRLERRRRYGRSHRTGHARRAGRGRYSLRLKNKCRRRVKLFLGRKPRFSSGRNTSLGANSITSFSGSAPETIWIVGSSGRGVSSYALGPGRHELVITRSCQGFAPGRY